MLVASIATAERLDLIRSIAVKSKQAPMYDRRCLGLSPEEVEAKLKQDVPYTIRLKV